MLVDLRPECFGPAFVGGVFLGAALAAPYYTYPYPYVVEAAPTYAPAPASQAPAYVARQSSRRSATSAAATISWATASRRPINGSGRRPRQRFRRLPRLAERDPPRPCGRTKDDFMEPIAQIRRRGVLIRMFFKIGERMFGQVPTPERLMAHRPSLMLGIGGLYGAIEWFGKIDRQLRALLNVQVATLYRAPY